jgi:S-adenosylmethionine-diacylglycerol 3-amino-3-carboxypropyl transferase
MESFRSKLREIEFEARILVSFGIVILACLLSHIFFPGSPANVVRLGRLVGLHSDRSLSIGYLVVALIMTVVSVLRMWAGSVLTSQRVMAFRVQVDSLITAGPYRIVRNPIYLADLAAMCGFALVLPIAGLVLPILFYLHYIQLIAYEEKSFEESFKDDCKDYFDTVPRLIPNFTSLSKIGRALREFEVNRDGIRHNALFVLFIPGFLLAASTHEVLHAIVIGLLAVIDWPVVHTRIGVQKRPDHKATQRENAAEIKSSGKKVFDDILYSQCWEDPAIDRAAFNIKPDDVVFSITSGGCNVLAFLLDGPKKIIALDLNPTQNYLLELKIAAFKNLTYDELLEFVGVQVSGRRLELYQRVRPGLRFESRTYWDHQLRKIEEGIIHCGRYEHYMGLLRKWLTRFMGRQLIEEFFTTEDRHSRSRLYHRKWENIWWWLFTKVLLSRTTMSLLFDKAFFAYLDKSFSFGKHFAGKAELALTELPMKGNYFLSYILLGRYYDEEHLPPYLWRENYETIRDRVDRIEVVCDSCGHFFASLPDETISKLNFTNIFEWMSPEAYKKLLKETIRVAREGAIMTYRNLLVFRERPVSLQSFIHPHRALARELHEADLSFIYDNYVVEEIHKKGNECHTTSEQLATLGQ